MELNNLRWHDGLGVYTGRLVAKHLKAYHEKITAACRKVHEEAEDARR